MKRYSGMILSCLSLLWANQLQGQKNYELSQPETNSKTYIARDYIRLLPGFSFNAAGGKTFQAYINEHLLEPASYQTSSQIPSPNRSVNTAYAVGTIAGEASVSSTGAAVYQIPIYVMPGTGSVQPGLSVSYNSQAGNGLIGYGWSLNAVSGITRVGKTIYHDGSAGAPNLTSSDNLMFDGQRLMRVSGSNLATSSTYKTEIESYLEITCKTINSFLGFEVKNKEGWTMEYGSSADSYIKPKDGTAAYAWLLKKATDANGNYMTYTYENNAGTGEFRLKQIDYTGNEAAGLAPYNRIEFFYETRSDKATSYIAGKSVEQSVILKRIKCSAFGSALREYRFNYYYDGFYSKLTEVEEYGQYGMRYNSTAVDWGYQPQDIFQGTEQAITVSGKTASTATQYADFNGDGKTDFIAYPNKASYSASDVATLYLATKNNGQVAFTQKATIQLVDNFKSVIITDMNGDGLLDVIRTSQLGDKYIHALYTFSGETFTFQRNFTSAGKKVWTGNFSGKGKHELILESERTILNIDGATVGSATIDWGKVYYDFFPNNTYLTDFTGNGKTNILTLDGSGCKVYELNGSSLSEITTFATSHVKNNDGIIFGDYNGDGKIDLLIQRNNASYFILFSTGTSFIKHDLPNLDLFSLTLAGTFNKDSKTGIVQFYGKYNYYNYTNKFIARIGTYNGQTFDFQAVECTGIQTNATMMVTNYYNPIDDYNGHYLFTPDRNYWNVSDFDGDGRLDIMYNDPSSKLYFKSFNDPTQLFVRSITNGLNQKYGFQYQPLSNTSNYTSSSVSTVFPVCKIQPALYVVCSFTKQAGNVNHVESYYYKGAKMHKQGKGFLGFEEVTVSNSTQNRKTTTQYGYNSTYYNVYPVKQTVTTLSGDSVSRTNFVNDYYSTYLASVSKYVIFPYVSSQTTVDKLTGITKKTEYAYASSDHGNPWKITETQGSLITVTNCTWEAKNSTYKNRPTQQIITKTGWGTAFSQTKKFGYDTKARLTQEIDYYGHPKAVTTTYGNHDNFGNPRTIAITAANCPNVTSNFVYDATGRFVTNSTDALGNVSTAQHDPATGALLEKTDIAGLKTTCQYDGFQRLVREISPVDMVNYSTAWDISGDALFKTTANSLVAGAQTSWYSTAGLETKKQTQGFSGMVVTEKAYNSKGLLYREYLPGYGARSAQYIEYVYDNFGRLQSEINIGRTTSYNYNGLTTTLTLPDGTTRSSTLNLSGLVASSKDAANNSVTYTYNSLGKPLTTTSNGITSTITYDDRGYQQSLKDANLANPIQYVYDAYGRMTSQTNGRGQVTSMQYDVAGRIVSQVSPERTLTYQYVASGDGIGQLQSIKEGGNTVQSFTYNRLGQALSVVERIDDKDYTTLYSYDAHGQLQQKTSPSGFRVGYEYVNGQMTAVRNMENNALLWKMDAVNAMGQITKSSLGNDLKRLYSYDDYHLPSRIVLDNGSFPYDQINYTFNATTGNLSQRNNETYGYDNLNRLVSVGLNGAPAMSMSYLDNGNMASKSDVGDYQYADGNHAVSAITNQAAGYNPPALDMTYTSYNRVASITQQGSVTKKLNLYYGPDNQRRKTQYYENGVLKKTKYFVGDYEKEGLKEFDYIYTPEGMAAVAVKEQNNTRVIYYTHTDHLGSVRVYTQSGSSSPSALYDYDAWGKRTFRGGSLDQFSRGYLGQEHLPEFGLINLNARMYDPVLGRFLGVDPYVQTPDFTQSHNRYVYGLNNPMRYVDPDGEFWQFIVAAVFIYAMTARENSAYYDENGVKTYPDSPLHWQWNPTKWNHVEVSGGMNTDGSNPYVNVSAGSPNSPMITVGYQQGKGVGGGVSYQGNTSMYYPGYNYGAPDQAVQRFMDMAQQAYSIEVNRFAETGNSTISEFYAYGPIPLRPVSGYILEPGGPSTSLSGKDKRIPANLYDIDPYSSAQYPNNYVITNNQVSYDRRILIHSGNYHTNTLGCLLPGDSYGMSNGDYYVGNSRTKMNELRRLLRTNSAYMIIWEIGTNPDYYMYRFIRQ